MHKYPADELNEDVFYDDSDVLNEPPLYRRTNTRPSNIPEIHRALSTVSANQTLVYNQRNILAKNFRRISVNDEIVTIDHGDADASFLLPNLHEVSETIRNRVIDSLVDTPTMTTLEESRRLNWWVNKKLPCPKLYPLLTSGDGNCLLHATSLAMWGFHDHSLSMRKALNETMITSKPNNSLYRRWRWAQSVQNKKYGLVFSEQEWNEEWQSLLRLSSAEPRISQTKSSDTTQSNNSGNLGKSSQSVISAHSDKSIKPCARQYYESLEEFHVYVLANNIRRPIIVYSDTVLRTNDGEAISPIEFGGIYLPLEIPPEKCHKQPVFLAFDAAHFSALVPMDQQNSKNLSKMTYRIPLIDIDNNDLLPIHFFIDPGPDFSWPNNEELSDEKIHLYTHFGVSRIEILEAYLNLSKETCQLNLLQSNNNPCENDSQTIIEKPSNSLSASDVSPLCQENSSVTSSNIPKKPTRASLNSFSRMIRRTFLDPFSISKRASLKQQRQLANSGVSDSSIINENDFLRRTSSPLLDPQTNTLTIIVTNFQPKRPKTSDNMIKNYIETCMNESRQEKNKVKLHQTLSDENKSSPERNRNQLQLNSENDFSTFQPVMTNPRSYLPSSTNRTHVEMDLATKISEKRKNNSMSNNSTTVIIPLSKSARKTDDFDENDDASLFVGGQLSSNVNYLQRRPNQLKQSNSIEIYQKQTRPAQSHINGYSSNRMKDNHGSIYRSSSKGFPSTYQPAPLKRQQSLSFERNFHPSSNINQGSITVKHISNQPSYSSDMVSHRTRNSEHPRRS